MNYLDKIFLDNTIRSYLFVLSIIFFIWLVRHLLSRYIAILLYEIVRRVWNTIEKKQFILLILRPLGWFITIAVAIGIISQLNFPEAWHFNIYKYSFETIIKRAAAGIILISFFRLILRLIDFTSIILEKKARLTPDKRDDQIVIFFRDFLKVIVGIIGLLMFVRVVFNMNISSLLTGLSIVGAALALAAKESIENLIASFVIFFDRPYITGDTVKVNTVTGAVEHIGLRSTRIRTQDKTLVTVPNKQMVDSMVDNWTMRTQRRAEMRLEFSANSAIKKVESFLADASKILKENQEQILKSSVFVTEFNNKGITIVIEYFTHPITIESFNTIKQTFNLSVKKLIEDAKLELAASGPGITIYTEGSPEPPRQQPIV